MATINETEARLNSHEAVCALRYEQINARLKRLEGILLKTAGIMLVSMAGVIWASVNHLPKTGLLPFLQRQLWLLWLFGARIFF